MEGQGAINPVYTENKTFFFTLPAELDFFYTAPWKEHP